MRRSRPLSTRRERLRRSRGVARDPHGSLTHRARAGAHDSPAVASRPACVRRWAQFRRTEDRTCRAARTPRARLARASRARRAAPAPRSRRAARHLRGCARGGAVMLAPVRACRAPLRGARCGRATCRGTRGRRSSLATRRHCRRRRHRRDSRAARLPARRRSLQRSIPACGMQPRAGESDVLRIVEPATRGRPSSHSRVSFRRRVDEVNQPDVTRRI